MESEERTVIGDGVDGDVMTFQEVMVWRSISAARP